MALQYNGGAKTRMAWDNFAGTTTGVTTSAEMTSAVVGEGMMSHGLFHDAWFTAAISRQRSGDDKIGATFDSLIGRQISGQSIVVRPRPHGVRRTDVLRAPSTWVVGRL